MGGAFAINTAWFKHLDYYGRGVVNLTLGLNKQTHKKISPVVESGI